MTVPYTFASQVGTIPLAELDANFATPFVIGVTTITLGDTVLTLNGVTFTNTTLTPPLTMTGTSASTILTLNQTGSGNAFVVEDSASPDPTPFVIDSNGNVIIGNTVTTPSILGAIPQLGVTATTTPLNQLLANFVNTTNAPYLTLAHSRGASTGTQTLVQIGDDLGTVAFAGSDGTQFVRGAQISAQVDSGTPSVTSMPGRMLFYTTPDGSATLNQRMSIESYGGVSIGAAGGLAGASLYITKVITGATSAFGVRQSGSVDLTSVTSTAYGFLNISALNADALTLPSYIHYGASQGTFGAGSAVTNQYGFLAFNALIGATNNYGFHAQNTAGVTAGKTAYGYYSAINTATGGGTTYAFYAAGTAPSIFNGDVQTVSQNGGQLAGMRNRIINGSMLLAQHATTATVTAGTAVPTAVLGYPCVDRFFVYGVGGNVTAARVNGADATSKRLQITGVAGVTSVGVGQRVEANNCFDMAGSTCTLSVELSNSLLTTVTWTASYATTTADTFGTIATPTKTQIDTGTFTVTATPTIYSVNIAVPAGATTGIEILFTVGAQISGTWTIGSVQFEEGAVATPFERLPSATVAALCQRYYYKILAGTTTGILGSAYIQTTSTYKSYGSFPVLLRAVPTTLETTGTLGDYSILSLATVTANTTAVPAFNARTNQYMWFVDNTTGATLVAGQGGVMVTSANAGTYLAWGVEIP